jgi:hypothetical protein
MFGRAWRHEPDADLDARVPDISAMQVDATSLWQRLLKLANAANRNSEHFVAFSGGKAM